MYQSDSRLNNDQDNSTTATFRVNNHVLSKLRSESEKRQISLNAYINQILRHYAEWELFEPKLGLIPFPKRVLADIFANMDAAEIVGLANGVGKNTAIDMSIFVQGKFNAELFLSWFESRMNNSGCEVSRRNYGSLQTLIIKHDFGKNWSLYLKTMLESTLKEQFGKAPVTFITDSITSLEWKE